MSAWESSVCKCGHRITQHQVHSAAHEGLSLNGPESLGVTELWNWLPPQLFTDWPHLTMCSQAAISCRQLCATNLGHITPRVELQFMVLGLDHVATTVLLHK